MADNELGGLALIAVNYGADDQDPPEDENNATQPSEERMEVESTSTSHNGAHKSPQNLNNTNRARLSFKLTKNPSPVRRTLFSGSQAADPPAQSFNNSQIAPAPRKFLTYGDRTRSAPAVLTNHVAPFPGLDNLGNTCYINSVLQVLYHAKEFRGHLNTANSMNGTLFSMDTESAVGRPLFDSKNTRHVHIARDLINQFLDLFKEMDERYHKLSHLYAQQHELDLNTAISAAIVPRPLMKALGAIDPQFGPGTEQQDVQEFIRVVLGHLDDADKTCTKVFSEIENHIKRRKRSRSDMMSDIEENGHGSNGREQNGHGYTNGANGYHSHTNTGDEPPFKKQRLDGGHNGAMNNGTNYTHEHNGHSNNGTTTPKYLSPLKKSVSSPAPETRLSYIERLFQGCSVNSIKCLECENVSARSENFLDLSLTIEKGQNLLWSIAQFASSEQLRGDNKYSCENCRTHTEAVKSTKFGALPRILTIHLKRFRHEMYSTEKINHHIPSPLYLKLDQWCEKTCKEKNTIYELFGIIFHQGSSMSYGHYFSYLKVKRPIKDEDSYGSNGHNSNGVHIPGTDFFSTSSTSVNGSDNKEEHNWIHCDDETVTFKTEKEITNLFNMESKSSSTAYILFYRSLDDQDLRCIDSTYLYKHLNKV